MKFKTIARKSAKISRAAAEHKTESEQSRGIAYALSNPEFSASRPVIQREVLSRYMGEKATEKEGETVSEYKYYSTLEPRKTFDTYEKAYNHDQFLRTDEKKIKARRKKKRKNLTESNQPERFPTIFSYYNTEPHNAVSKSNQGPHTLSYTSFHARSEKRFNDTKLSDLVEKQILTVPKFKELVNTENPTNLFPEKKKRLIKDFKILNQQLQSELVPDRDPGHAQRLFLRMTQMDPYTVYGTNQKIKSKHLKNKGERHDDEFDDAFDKYASFVDNNNYNDFKKRRRELYKDGDFENPTRKKKKTKNEENDEEIDFLPQPQFKWVNPNQDDSSSEDDNSEDLDYSE